MNLVRNLIIVTALAVLAVGAVVYTAVQDATVSGIGLTVLAVVLVQVLYHTYRKTMNAVSVSSGNDKEN